MKDVFSGSKIKFFLSLLCVNAVTESGSSLGPQRKSGQSMTLVIAEHQGHSLAFHQGEPMNIQSDTEVRSIAIKYPATSRVFEHFGIDYYCDRGHRSLADACENLLLPLEEVLRELNEQKNLATAADHAEGFPFDPQTAPLANIIQYIVRRYHMTARQEIPRIQTLAEKVRRRYGASHPEVIEVERIFHALSEDLQHHMHKEEQALFPSITGQHRMQHGTIPVLGTSDGFDAPIRVMEAEHQACEDMLQRIRLLTKMFLPPSEACPTFRAFYQGLAQFDRDTREHLNVENSFLFPRALGQAPATARTG